MKKEIVILHLQDIIDTIKLDKRKQIKGIMIKYCDKDWKYKNKTTSANILIEWNNQKIYNG
jgi:hypothetical protein